MRFNNCLFIPAGDWLHSINGIIMTPDNIESYLRNISFSKEVKEVFIFYLIKTIAITIGELKCYFWISYFPNIVANFAITLITL